LLVFFRKVEKEITELLDKIKIRIQNNNVFFEEILKNQKDILENK
jgi:hypothetical protein